MNNIKIPVSVGEILDKLSILNIKKSKIKDSSKLNYISEEFDFLFEKSKIFFKNPEILSLFKNLESVNNDLWEIEDRLRDLEKVNTFDDIFIDLARSVYKTNDKRFLLKNKINELSKSKIREQKGYC
jgi:hypothetical protein